MVAFKFLEERTKLRSATKKAKVYSKREKQIFEVQKKMKFEKILVVITYIFCNSTLNLLSDQKMTDALGKTRREAFAI